MVAASYTEFRKNMKSYMDRVNDDVDHVVITRQGDASNAVLVSEAEWNSLQETIYCLCNTEIMESLEKSLADIEEGRLLSFDSIGSFKEAMQK